MKKWQRLLSITLAVLLFCGVTAAALIYRNRKTDYAVQSKNTVAMGTIVSLKLYDETTPNLCDRATELIQTLEGTISWRIDTSPVAKLNRTGATENEMISSLVEQCRAVSQASGGAFDVTVGKVSTLWDFGGENERLPDAAEIADALRYVDYTKLHTSGKIVTAAKGQQLDFGAVGKGLACDTVKAFLKNAGVKGGVISVGGSICAFGSRNKAGDPWRVAIKHPTKSDAFLGVVTLKEGFVSTSGDYEKYFEQDGKRYFHILDARTGYPADSALTSVTVVCGNGMLSDALSTACFLLGEEKSRALLAQYDAAAIFVTADGAISTVGDVNFTAYES